MSIERTSLVTSLPWFSKPLRLVMRRRADSPPQGIVAQRRELSEPGFDQLSYYTNLNDHASRHAPALLLLHAPGLGTSADDLWRLFEAFRDERALFAPDLPGFGRSPCPREPLSAEPYARAIERMTELAATRAEGGVDVLALGLSAEFVAKVAAQRPDLVRSLTLLNPTGFAADHGRSTLEDAARHGRTLWPLTLLRRLGLGPLLVDALSSRVPLRRERLAQGLALSPSALRHARVAARRPDATRAGLAYLAGVLYPRDNPLAIYTRVHCPTLVVTSHDMQARFHELPRFVKWRDHFSALALDQLDLSVEHDSAVLAEAMRAFWDGPGRRSRVC